MSKQRNMILQLKSGKEIRFEYQSGFPFFAVLSEVLEKEGVAYSLCGGQGICGRCRIRFVEGAPLPQMAERRFLSPKELRDGIRLACMTEPAGDCVFELLFETQTEIVQKFYAPEGKLPKKAGTIITADIGTTTIAMALRELSTGKVLDTYAAFNPQRRWGADVIARIQAAKQGHAKKLQSTLQQVFEEGIEHFKGEGDEIYIAANTVMSHLFMGASVEDLGQAPFRPEFLEEQELRILGKKAVLLPGISAFVGADITAGLLSCKMFPPGPENKGTLLIDLGTNAEMVICNGTRLFATAAAAGPAFEGGSAQAQIGSDMVKLLAQLRRKNIVDTSGLMKDPWFTNGYKADGQQITNQEVRALQLAKAAVRTGIELLLEESGMQKAEIQRVYLAGGFGYRISPQDAAFIGLIPSDFQEKTIAVGNAALEGAFCYGCMEYGKELEPGETGRKEAARKEADRKEAGRQLRENCITLNLAEHPRFMERFVEEMDFREG